jgi:hypothetical protein
MLRWRGVLETLDPRLTDDLGMAREYTMSFDKCSQRKIPLGVYGIPDCRRSWFKCVRFLGLQLQ